jgi:hypothetical protein
VQNIFTAREPNTLASFPPGYLAETGVLNQFLRARQDVPGSLKGLRFLSDYVRLFGESATYELEYALHPKAVTDLAKDYEGWLYDRCATLLLFYAHTGDTRMLRHGYRACAYYADHIQTDGPNRGIFNIKSEPDTKYSHLRGLYAYYALTGDEAARAAGAAIAEMWYVDRLFVQPYANGHTRSPEALWTERLLGTSLEGLYYGHVLTGDHKYLQRFEQLLDTAYRHITTQNQDELNAINQLGKPPYVAFPPQNCFVHSAEQHGERGPADPWCSGWMNELLVDPLLKYQEQTGDRRVDEIFVRLSRFMRDMGTSYFKGDPRPDSFLHPSLCFDRHDSEDPRILVPLYGSGVATGEGVKRYGEWADFEHCPDSMAMTAVALRGLARVDVPGPQGAIGPFANETLALKAMHREFAFCAAYAFRNATRPHRDPRSWPSKELAEGYQGGDTEAQQKWIEKNLIGFPIYPTSPQRKLSWWFNTSLLQYGLLADAGVSFETIGGGAVQPATCH